MKREPAIVVEYRGRIEVGGWKKSATWGEAQQFEAEINDALFHHHNGTLV
jgi:hypothetical protein